MRYLTATARPIAEDLAGTLVFYLLFIATGSAVIGATVGFLIGLGQVAHHSWEREPLPGLLLVGLALTVVLGGATLLTHDPRIILAKPSILYAVLGVTMLPRGWVTRYVPLIARELLPSSTWDRVGWAWAALMLATAALNPVLLAILPLRQAAAVFTVWVILSKLALFGVQYVLLRGRARRAHADATARALDAAAA